MAEVFIGVDVSMDWVDIWEPERGHERVANTPKKLAKPARRWAREGATVVFEASGGYDRPLRTALDEAGVAHARVNPGRARDFAKAMGLLGKSDRVDARMLAEMGARLPLRRTEPLTPARRALQALAARRRQLVGEAEEDDADAVPEALEAVGGLGLDAVTREDAVGLGGLTLEEALDVAAAQARGVVPHEAVAGMKQPLGRLGGVASGRHRSWRRPRGRAPVERLSGTGTGASSPAPCRPRSAACRS